MLHGESGLQIEFDDRTLAHLQIVIGAKLRRREGFFFSWKDDPAGGGGRSSIWLQNSIPLYFEYSKPTRHTINQEWLDLLISSARQAQGMQLIGEPGEKTPPPKSYV